MIKQSTLWPKVYAVKHSDKSVIAASRSGGIFTVLSDAILDEHGVVYGCILTDNFTATHVRATTRDLRNKMRGSKYIQSTLQDTYKTAKSDLDTGKKVLFSGTSCQIAGLKKYLNKEYDNLICVDIVCHGVPSEKVWLKYLSWQENRTKSSITGIDFRDKERFGWRAHKETLYLDNNISLSSSVFRTLFYGHECLRPSCYKCPYKNITHPGDITIADYWGIEIAAPEFDDNKGVSLVLVNNDKGSTIMEACKSNIIWKETRIEDSMQPPLKAPFPKPKNRDAFWKDFNNSDFMLIAKKYGGYGAVNKVKKAPRILWRRFKKLCRHFI